MDDAARFEAHLLVERLYDLRERIEDTEERIAQICQRFPTYRRLLTIQGFGPYVASQVIARIGDPHRFAGRKQLIRLADYNLNAKRSGKCQWEYVNRSEPTALKWVRHEGLPASRVGGGAWLPETEMIDKWRAWRVV